MSLFEAISSSVFLSFSFLLTYLIMQRLLAQFEFSNGLEDVVLVSTRLLQFSDAEALQARMCSKATVSARACVCMIKDWEKDEEEEEEDEVEEEEEAKAHHLIDAGLKLGRLFQSLSFGSCFLFLAPLCLSLWLLVQTTVHGNRKIKCRVSFIKPGNRRGSRTSSNIQ